MALALENRSSLHCLFLDFSKAFDSVPHERLLLKLDSIDIRGKLRTCLDTWVSYLSSTASGDQW